jgi:histidinol-phosphate aminotransferase
MTQLSIPATSVPLSVYRRPDARPDALRLDGNEGNQPDPRLLGLVASLGPDVLRNYPDLTALVAAIAGRFRIEPDRVVVTAGADDAIDRVCRAFLGQGRELLLPIPTFEMLYRFAEAAGASVVTVPWNDAFPTEAVIERIGAQTTLIAMVSPNNPTGRVASLRDLERVAAAAESCVVLLDHAYVEYANEDLTAAALELGNVVIVRTLSKAWGLAGCRVGYAMASAELANVIRNAGNPYPISALSAAVTLEALRQGRDSIAAHVASVRELRASLTESLRQLGAAVEPSQGNFVFAEFGARVRFVDDALAAVGIVVRYFPNRPEIQRGLRITVPDNESDLNRLTAALESCLAPEALLFDMDGVLADVEQSYRRCVIETARAFGATVDRAQLEAAVFAGDANNDWELTRRLLAGQDIAVSLSEIRDKFQQLYLGAGDTRGLREDERLIPSRALLRELSARIPLGIVTGRPRAEAEWFLAREGIEDLFAAVVCLEDGPVKPDPAPVLEAMRRMKVSRAWMVGDTPDDVNAAAGAGALPISTIAPGDSVERGNAALKNAGAATVLTDLATLKELLP